MKAGFYSILQMTNQGLEHDSQLKLEIFAKPK